MLKIHLVWAVKLARFHGNEKYPPLDELKTDIMVKLPFQLLMFYECL